MEPHTDCAISGKPPELANRNEEPPPFREAANQGGSAVKSLPLFVALLAAGSASAAQVWVAPAAQKIRPSAQPPAGATAAAKIAAAKNEFEAFQVVVTGQADSVSMILDALRDSAGHTISGRDVVLYREALLNVTAQSGGDGATGM